MKLRNFDREKLLRWGTGLTTALYVTVFFGKLTWRYVAWRASGLDIDWTVPTNPQSMIALCLMTATLSLCFLRDRGKRLAGLLLMVVIAFFGYWAVLTKGIKTNMSVTDIPQTGFIDNFWIGATWLDPIVLGLALILLILDGTLILSDRRAAVSDHSGNFPPLASWRV